jgi:hypothetical protein
MGQRVQGGAGNDSVFGGAGGQHGGLPGPNGERHDQCAAINLEADGAGGLGFHLGLYQMIQAGLAPKMALLVLGFPADVAGRGLFDAQLVGVGIVGNAQV